MEVLGVLHKYVYGIIVIIVILGCIIVIGSFSLLHSPNKYIPAIKVISKNQACSCLRLAHAWFNNLKQSMKLINKPVALVNFIN